MRSIDQIYQDLITEKQTFASLSGLTDNGVTNVNDLISQANSGSIVSEHLLWLYLFAYETSITESLYDVHRDEIQAIKDSAFVGTVGWYIDRSKLWQYGDVLLIDPTTYTISYATIDESLQLIGSAVITELTNKIILKIRGKNSNLLTVDELNSFTAYINKIKIAGTNVNIWNYDPDNLKLYMEILYNKEIPLATIQNEVETAINTYITNIEYNSFLNVNTLIDKLQAIDGIIDPRFDSAEGKFSTNPYVSFVHEYFAIAGYCTIDSSFPLSDTITYTAK